MTPIHNKKIINAVFMCTLGVACTANAEKLVLSGNVKTISPKPEVIIPESGLFKGVKEYTLKASPVENVCSYVLREYQAVNGLDSEDWKCLFQWQDQGDNFVEQSNLKRGIFQDSGTVAYPYSIYVYSGSVGKKVNIYNGQYAFDVSEPVPPKVVEAEGIWAYENKKGLLQKNFDAKDKLRGLSLKFEPRPYDQVAKFEESTCKVKEGDTNCVLLTTGTKFGSIEEEPTGFEVFDVPLNSATQYYTNQSDTLRVEWDYRPPELEAFAYHVGNDIEESKTISVNGTDIAVNKEEAVVVVGSPHNNKEGDWWYPARTDLLLETAEGAEQSSRMDIGEQRIYFDIPHISWNSKYEVQSQEPELIDGLIVYRYKLENVPDGKYNANFNLNDRYGNGELFSQNDNLLDRFPPAIEILMAGRQLNFGTNLFFTEDLGAVAHGGWDDGTHITSIKLGEVELKTEGEKPNLQYVTENVTSLESKQEYPLVVTAEDGQGNQATKQYLMKFMPADFEMAGVPEKTHQKVQKAKLYANQVMGRCPMATSEEVAQLITSPYSKACTVKWTNTPEGMSVTYLGWTSAIEGGVDTLGENTAEFEVWLHNTTGNKLKLDTETESFNVVPADPLELKLESRNKLADRVYGMPYNSDMVTRYSVTSNPGAYTVTQTLEDTGETDSKEFNQLPFERNYRMTGNINVSDASQREIFDRFTVTLDASYNLDQSLQTKESIEVIRLPYKYVNSYIHVPAGAQSSEDTVPVTVNVGQLERSSETYEYDAAKMGEWNVHLAYRDGAEMVSISDSQQVDESGQAVFDMEAEKLFEKSRTVYAIGNLISPHPEYEKEIKSAPAAIEVLKGTGIEGELESRRVTGRIPFAASVRFAYESSADRDASTNLRWETSEDGQTWEPAPEFDGRQYTSYRLSEPDSVFVRAKVDNKLTGQTTVTSTLEIASYAVARLDIEGPRQLYKGMEGSFSLANYGELIHESEGVAEWSTDEGETWVEGGVTESFAFEEDIVQLKARFRYNTTSEIVGDEGWSESSKYIQAKEPKPVRIMANVPSLSEAGVPVKLGGYAQNPFGAIPLGIESEWVMPDGSVEKAMDAEYTFAEGELQESDNLDFTFRAWVKGYKEDTLAEQTRSTKGWSYEFPDITMTLNSNITVAPSNIYAAVQQPYVFAPNVSFEYEWEVDEEMARIEYSNNRSALIIAEKSGMQQIKVTVRDNRGNEETLTGYIDVVAPEDMDGQMNVYPSNPHFRAPVVVNMSASATPGHPRDYAKEYKWMVDGKVIEGETRSTAKKEITEPGSYELSVEVTTQYGQKTVITEDIMVVPNENPQCEPVMNTSGSYITLRTQCTDPDGRIIGYRWIWNGEEQGPYGTQIRFNKQQYESLDVTFFAIDDSGGETKGDFSW